jgi:lipopolysaccharide transport system ATP-binding protein
MSEVAIRLQGLGKMYKLYHRPVDKVLDVFGLGRWLFWRQHGYQEFWALRDWTLEIAKGERVGIIGRNGAGKSTLLKIIAGNIAPTEGTLEIQGRIQALMELGTGFHPEFTGRQNIYAALVYQGLSPAQSREKVEEIIDFAELEEFIEQPIKTYSAGMYARLAFSTATAIKPEILIIDEVLGAGDAYFAGKCMERMRQLTEESGATVLFVSHDLSSVELLCTRCLWVERGRLQMDSLPQQVSRAYAAMVREREMLRLQARNAMVSVATMRSMRRQGHVLQMIVRFVHEGGTPAKIRDIGLRIPGFPRQAVRVGEPQDTALTYDAFILMDQHFSTWSAPGVDRLGSYRCLTDKGERSSAVVFNLAGLSQCQGLQLDWQWQGAESCYRVELFDGQIYRPLMHVEEGAVGAQRSHVDLPPEMIRDFLQRHGIVLAAASPHAAQQEAQQVEKPESVEASKKSEIFTGDILLETVKIVDAAGRERYLYQSFEPLRIVLRYRALQSLKGVEFVVCFHRMGQIILQSLSGLQSGGCLDLEAASCGSMVLHIPQLPFGRGTYLLSVGVFPALDHHSLDTEKTAYYLIDRQIELRVEQPEDIAMDLGLCRCETVWAHEPSGA